LMMSTYPSQPATLTNGISQKLQTANHPLLLLMGLPRSGKTSIYKVVFEKMSPLDTFTFHTDAGVVKRNVSSFVDFRVWDFPGHVEVANDVFNEVGVLVYAIDSLDDYGDSIARLNDLICRSQAVNPTIRYEVFVHKVDGLSEDVKDDTLRDIRQRVQDRLEDEGLEDVHINFYMTSVYDYSVFEACSRVVQKLIPQSGTLESLLDALTTSSGIDKAFLFDVKSRIFIAADSNPFQAVSFELSVDLMDLVFDLCAICDGEAEAEYSFAAVKLNNGVSLFLRQLNRLLAIVYLMRTDNYEEKHGWVEYNVSQTKEGIMEILAARSSFG